MSTAGAAPGGSGGKGASPVLWWLRTEAELLSRDWWEGGWWLNSCGEGAALDTKRLLMLDMFDGKLCRGGRVGLALAVLEAGLEREGRAVAMLLTASVSMRAMQAWLLFWVCV
jgi:hypothetical protein